MTDDLIGKTIPLIKERLVKLSDYPSLVDFLIEEPKVDKKLLIKKGGGDSNLIKKQFEIILKELEKAGWETSKLETLFREIAQTQKFHIGKFFMAVRIALTGKTATPPLFEMMEVLGKEKTTLRIKKSLALLS